MGRAKKIVNLKDDEKKCEPLMHFKGWLPMNDKNDNVESLRVKLESFIREVLNA